MNHQIGVYLREQRHIFGICPNPNCRNVARLTDLQVSYRTRYASDWLDKIEQRALKWQGKIDDFEEKREGVREEYRQKAIQKILPYKIRSIFPLFRRQHIKPTDVRILSHPVDFVAFDGMGDGNLRRIVLLDQKEKAEIRRDLQKKVESAVNRGDYDMHILRVDEMGVITRE